MLIKVDGPARLFIGAPACVTTYAISAMEELGVTESGVQISIGGQAHRVMSDDMGGSEGMPAELLYMGATASIRGVMVKYNGEQLGLMVSGLNNANEGEVYLPGTPIFAGGLGFSLLIGGRQQSYFFPRCELLSQPREFNISTTERKTSFTATAYPIFTDCANGKGFLYVVKDGMDTLCPGCSQTQAYGGAVAMPTAQG